MFIRFCFIITGIIREIFTIKELEAVSALGSFWLIYFLMLCRPAFIGFQLRHEPKVVKRECEVFCEIEFNKITGKYQCDTAYSVHYVDYLKTCNLHPSNVLQ